MNETLFYIIPGFIVFGTLILSIQIFDSKQSARNFSRFLKESMMGMELHTQSLIKESRLEAGHLLNRMDENMKEGRLEAGHLLNRMDVNMRESRRETNQLLDRMDKNMKLSGRETRRLLDRLATIQLMILERTDKENDIDSED